MPDFKIATPNGLKSINQFTYKDVAHSLANQNRFSGHLNRQVSIGMHSLHTLAIARAMGLNRVMQKVALWHDGPESYYGDIPTYVKAQLNQEAKDYLVRKDVDFFNHFRVPLLTLSERQVIKEIDRTALTLEARFGLDNFNPNDWPVATAYQGTNFIENINNWFVFFGISQIEKELIHEFRSFQNV